MFYMFVLGFTFNSKSGLKVFPVDHSPSPMDAAKVYPQRNRKVIVLLI